MGVISIVSKGGKNIYNIKGLKMEHNNDTTRMVQCGPVFDSLGDLS